MFYGDLISFVYSLSTWTSQGGHWRDGIITGVFAFRCWIGGVDNLGGSRLYNNNIIWYYLNLFIIDE